jgi:hypothetical protein
MTARFVAQIFKILKKWLLRLARSSAGLFLFFLSLLRRFAARPSKLCDTLTRLSTGALQSTIAGEDAPICSSLLPSGQPSLEVAGDPPSPSDVPYSGTHERSLRRDAQMPSPYEAHPSAEPYRLFCTPCQAYRSRVEGPTPLPEFRMIRKGRVWREEVKRACWTTRHPLSTHYRPPTVHSHRPFWVSMDYLHCIARHP